MDLELDEKEAKRWSQWNPQDGYTNLDDENNSSLPRRAISPGLHAGLTLVMNVEREEYYCSGTESVGFKVYF